MQCDYDEGFFSGEEDKKKYNASSNLKNLYVQTNVTYNRIFDR